MNDFDLKKYLAENRLLKENKIAQAIRDEAEHPDSKVGAAIFNKYAKKIESAPKEDYRKILTSMETELINKHPDTFDGDDDIVASFMALSENKLLKEANYTRLEDDGEKKYIDLDYDNIRAYIAGKKGQDFADDFIDGYNDEFYENVVRFLNKTKKPTDKEVTDFIDIEIEKEREEYIPAPNAPGGRGLSEGKLLNENIGGEIENEFQDWLDMMYTDKDYPEIETLETVIEYAQDTLRDYRADYTVFESKKK